MKRETDDKADAKPDGGPDDEGLSWAGDTDTTHVDAPVKPPEASAEGATEESASTELDAKPVTSSALLITLGILAGVYLLYTVGWVITTQRNVVVLPSLLDQVMFQGREFLAIMAPAVWFGSTLLLTRGRKPLVKLLWLIMGVVLLVPLPFVLGV